MLGMKWTVLVQGSWEHSLRNIRDFPRYVQAHGGIDAATVDGHSEAFPIVLPATVGESTFELFLSVCYGMYVHPACTFARQV